MDFHCIFWMLSRIPVNVEDATLLVINGAVSYVTSDFVKHWSLAWLFVPYTWKESQKSCVILEEHAAPHVNALSVLYPHFLFYYKCLMFIFF